MKMRTRIFPLLAASCISGVVIGATMTESQNQIIEESVKGIKESIDTYPADKQASYMRGLREGMDLCMYILPKEQSNNLAKHPTIQDLIDYMDSK